MIEKAILNAKYHQKLIKLELKAYNKLKNNPKKDLTSLSKIVSWAKEKATREHLISVFGEKYINKVLGK